MSEILTRLKLDTKNFDANLNKSKRYTKNWKNNSNSVMKGLTSSIMKLGGAMGAVAVATKTFNAIMKSSQSIGDAYAQVQAEATAAVGEFFYAMANGDFSSFNQGLDSLTKKAGEAYRAMDQLGNTMMSFDWAGSENMADITEAQAAFQKARSDGNKAGMDKALKDWQAAMSKQSEAVESVKQATWDAVSKEVTKSTNLDAADVSLDDIIKVRDIDITMPKIRDKIKKQYGAIYREYEKQSKEYAEKYKVTKFVTTTIADSKTSYEKATKVADPVKQNELANQYKDAIIYTQLLEKYSDEELKTVFDRLKQVNVIQRQLSKQQKTFETSRVQGVVTPTSTAPIEEVTKKGYDSLSALQERLKEANAQLMEASTTAARVAAQDLVDDLEAKVIHMKASISYAKNVSSDADFSSNMAGLPFSGSDSQPTHLGNTDTPTIGPVVDDSAIDTNNKYTDSLMAITNVMGNLGGAVDDSAQGWLSWGANLLTAIAAAIPAIGALSVANTVQGATAKDAAIAESAKSVAATPFVGPILAIAAIASMIAAFAAIPKFATGGIVPGNSFSGDKVPAMVNSGELILNEAQQGNLASKLATNRGVQNVNVGGSFVLRGKDLIATITKNNRIISRT